MAGINDNLTGIRKFLGVLSWKKILQITAFLFVIALAWATYDLRESIYNYANQSRLARYGPPIEKLSRKSAGDVDEAVAKANIIIGIQVVVADFQKNLRIPIYTSTTDPGLSELYEGYKKNSISAPPLFSADEINNRHTVELINGEFICYPFNESLVSKYVPEANKYIHTACAVGIPPYYGKFSGAIVIYTRRQPTAEEIDQIRNLAKTLSIHIYERDFR